MAFIRMIAPRRARGDLALAYRYMAEVGGQPMVARIMQVFSLRPSSLRRTIRGWELAMWVGDEPRWLRETVGAAVSHLNDCHY